MNLLRLKSLYILFIGILMYYGGPVIRNFIVGFAGCGWSGKSMFLPNCDHPALLLMSVPFGLAGTFGIIVIAVGAIAVLIESIFRYANSRKQESSSTNNSINLK